MIIILLTFKDSCFSLFMPTIFFFQCAQIAYKKLQGVPKNNNVFPILLQIPHGGFSPFLSPLLNLQHCFSDSLKESESGPLSPPHFLPFLANLFFWLNLKLLRWYFLTSYKPFFHEFLKTKLTHFMLRWTIFGVFNHINSYVQFVRLFKILNATLASKISSL